MIRELSRALALAVVVAAVPAATHAAGPSPIPTLKRAATVTSDLVRIGDLLDNAGAAADAPIFRAPDIGTAGSVSTDQVLQALRPYHIYLVDTAGLTAVEVTHAGRMIDVADIETSIARAFAGRYGFGDPKNLAITLDLPARPITVDAAALGDLTPTGVLIDPRSGRFDLTFAVPNSQGVARSVRYTGQVIETMAVAVATRGLARGDTVKASDIAIERRPKAEIGADGIATADDAVGLAVRQAVRQGQALRRNDLMKAELVHRDDIVTLVYEVPGILLTTQGKALEAGAQGDVISVLNVQSKRTVQGIVLSSNRVVIKAALARTTSQTTATAPQAAAPQSVASR
jgi:flagella basal body P-ring formation protein FlgA